MHELPVTEKILSIVLSRAAAHDADRIITITLEIGDLCDLEPVWLERYFTRLAAGTAAAGAKIVVHRLPVHAECAACASSFVAEVRARRRIRCRSCGSDRVRIVSGDEYRIRDIEVL